MNEYELWECYYCGEDVYIDSNNEDKDGNNCYYDIDRRGINIFTCPKHYHENCNNDFLC